MISRWMSVFFLMLIVSVGGYASKPKQEKKVIVNNKGKFRTDFDFRDHLVRGQVQLPNEATAVIEDDKALYDLLDVRKDFKDRLQQSNSRM